MISRKIILIFAGAVVIISIIAAGVFLSIGKRSNKGSTANNENSQNSLPATANPQNTSSATDGAQIPKNLPPGVSVVNLRPVDGEKGSGSFIAVNDSKNLSLVIEAQLPDLQAGQDYAAWIGRGQQSADLMMVGKLEKSGGKWGLSFSNNGDYTAYKLVVVTLQSGDSDEPQTHVLEGPI